MKDEIANSFNKHIKEVKMKAEKESVVAQKRHKAEVKAWKKDLDEERREKINLEKKLNTIIDKKKNDKIIITN